MTRTIRVGAPAKLNLTLEVVARLANGYHAIRSIFVKLPALADDIAVRIDPLADVVTVGCDAAAVPGDDGNVCHRAVTRYLAAIGMRAGVHVEIAKRIPVAAGLGGGSSDAAAVLKALNGHFDGALSQPRLAELGDAIGKDVPFFLNDAQAAFVSGMGEVIEPLAPLPALHFLMVNPGANLPDRGVVIGQGYYLSRDELERQAQAITARWADHQTAPTSTAADIAQRDRDVALFCLCQPGDRSGQFISTAVRDNFKIRAEDVAALRRVWRERHWLIPAGAGAERLSQAIRDLVGWVDPPQSV